MTPQGVKHLQHVFPDFPNSLKSAFVRETSLRNALKKRFLQRPSRPFSTVGRSGAVFNPLLRFHL
ncbi:hypothetical protein CD555_001260 [Salmonella enterica subsp. enterica serovar Mississippi]|nr:hypothetical protein [Salmonella enterica]EBT9749939.1 hypothetical protein [Salmonella enterica]EDS5869471.1 hypothetical protein [Salmonella enterica subsp. enterica serovar Mississippi]